VKGFAFSGENQIAGAEMTGPRQFVVAKPVMSRQFELPGEEPVFLQPIYFQARSARVTRVFESSRAV